MFLMCSGSSFHKVTPLYVKDCLNLPNLVVLCTNVLDLPAWLSSCVF